jgi:alkylated DNA nucleotide flippase Atl1
MKPMKDQIQTIPSGLEKYLGKGKMVLPSDETLRSELAKVPERRLTTIPMIRASIAERLGVTTACPKTTLKSLRNLMSDSNSGAYKVINGKGELVASDLNLQAELLEADGFEIDHSAAKPKVKNFKQYLVM